MNTSDVNVSVRLPAYLWQGGLENHEYIVLEPNESRYQKHYVFTWLRWLVAFPTLLKTRLFRNS